MKIVIQCASRKYNNAGRLTTLSGQHVNFVAHPEKCRENGIFYRPDDMIEGMNCTWRDYLKSYNKNNMNPNNLLKAGNLYKPAIYKELIDKYEAQKVFILSAGWGLIRSDFLIPYYNITFSNQGKSYSKRLPRDQFEDFNQLYEVGINAGETIYFFGGQAYLPLYYKLTQGIVARKVIYHSQEAEFHRQGYEFIHYRSFTNWHYFCARDFISELIQK